MKKWKMLMAFVLCAALQCGCAANTSASADLPTDLPEVMEDTGAGNKGGMSLDTSQTITLEQLRQAAAEKGDICAAAFLGYADTADFAAYIAQLEETKTYPFLTEIPQEQIILHPNGGTELYCIVPTDPKASLSVNDWVYGEDFVGKAGEVLYRSESGEPILLRGNLSDVMPDLDVEIVDSAGEALSYQPRLSLYDGSLNTPWYSPGVYDFTTYSNTDLIGTWVATNLPGYDEDFLLRLVFNQNGTVQFSYGEGNGELMGLLQGTCSRTGDAPDQYFLSLQAEDGSWLEGTYEIVRTMADEISLTCIDGQPLAADPENSPILFALED